MKLNILPIFCAVIFNCLYLIEVHSQDVDFKEIDSHTGSSFRAISAVNDQVLWVSGSNGWFGRSYDGGEKWEFDQIRLFEEKDFRLLYAFDRNNAIIANAGSPAYILRTSDGGENWIPAYQNSNPEIFLDGIDFWNDNEGLIYGDPINGKMTILKTFDGGYTWVEIEENKRPDLLENEASFAASGTNIRCFDHKSVAIATGGSKSRLFISEDLFNSWQIIDVPIIQGKESEGIFSFAISGENMVAVGGDYLKEDATVDHIFISHNYGKKWMKPDEATLGYRESVEYLDENSLICTGPNGTEFSNDKGMNWKSIQGGEGMHVVRKSRIGNLVVMAGRNGRIFVIR